MDGAASAEEGAAASAPDPVPTTDLLGLGESWADASEAPEPSEEHPSFTIEAENPDQVEATLQEIAQDTQAWVQVKKEAGLDAEGEPLAEVLEGAASRAPEIATEAALPPEAPELSSEPTISVDEDRITDLQGLELETNPNISEETPLDSETTAEAPIAEGAATGAPAEVPGTELINIEPDDEDPEDERSLPRPLTAGQSDLRTGSTPASGSQEPREKTRRGKRGGQQRATRNRCFIKTHREAKVCNEIWERNMMLVL